MTNSVSMLSEIFIAIQYIIVIAATQLLGFKLGILRKFRFSLGTTYLYVLQVFRYLQGSVVHK